jgi:hypothetical protein
MAKNLNPLYPPCQGDKVLSPLIRGETERGVEANEKETQN